MRLWLLLLLVALGVLAADAKAATEPCGPRSRTVVRDGASRIVRAADGASIYGCTPGRPHGLLLAREKILFDVCGSNSEAEIVAPDQVVALAGRYAAVGLLRHDDCDEDSFTLRRFDLQTGRATPIAAGVSSLGRVLVNRRGTVAFTEASAAGRSRVRIAARGRAPRLLLTGNEGSQPSTEIAALGSAALPVVSVTQGGSTQRLDSRRQLDALTRCGPRVRRLVTVSVAAGAARVCSLSTGRSYPQAGCRLARATALLCGPRLIDAARGKLLASHPVLGTVGPGEDAFPVPGARAVALHADEILLLGADGSVRVLGRSPERRTLGRLQVSRETVTWRSTDRRGHLSVKHAVRLPAPPG